MDPLLLGGVAFAIVLALVMVGLPIAFTLFTVGILGLLIKVGASGMYAQLAMVTYSWTFNFTLAVLPLFIFMGYLVSASGISEDVFVTFRLWLGRLPGGLAVATTLANAAFGATSGSSIAAASVFMKVAYPEMLRYGYDKRMAAGCILVAGLLAILIPPSTLLVLIGFLSDESIGKLLLAGFFPGIVTALVLCAISIALSIVNPKYGPPMREKVSWKDRIISLKNTWGFLLIVAIIVLGIYMGIFTPTEAAAVGVMGAALICLVRKKLTYRVVKNAVFGSGHTTSMVFTVLIGSILYSRFLVVSGFTQRVGTIVGGLDIPPMLMLVVLFGMYLFLGVVMETGPMTIITVPFVWPIIYAVGFNPIWFAILLVMMGEIAAISPPLGVIMYVVKALGGAGLSMRDVIFGEIPYLIGELIAVALIVIFPVIALWLPNRAFGVT